LRRIREYCQQHADARLVDNLGTRAYFSLMTVASAMVGNSSSGMIEAASFRLPVVNVGTRQLGRVRARNVIDVGYDRAAVRAGLARALSEEFRGGLSGLVNPYARGDAAELIVRRLRDVPLDERLTLKRFADLAPAGMGE
jgi:UDP-N-acetylglucosamine 2-epimerase